jgi:hypothetical protein
MSRVGYREIQSRFTHIDATLVEATVRFPEGEGIVRVRFYPWWEHPDYLAAVRTGGPWGFKGFDEGKIEVTVHPTHIHACRLSGHADVIDWAFLEGHPLLWAFEDAATVYCNASLDDAGWTALVAAVRRALPYPDRGHLGSVLRRELGSSSFALGTLPLTVYRAAIAALEELGLPYLAPRTPNERPLPRVLLLDDDDYIIADDFELDVPEVVHDKAWFDPRPRHGS